METSILQIINLDNPVFKGYIFYSSILVLKTMTMSILTGRQRFKNKTMNSPAVFSTSHNNTLKLSNVFLANYKHLFKWTKSEDMLEIGCANGRITKEVLYPFVKDHLRHLIATDISEPAIEAANESNNFSGLSFQVMDITDEVECHKYVEKFGHVFANYVFHMVHRHDLWSRNVHKMLKPNGQLFASIFINPNIYTETIAAQKRDKSKPWSKYLENLPDLMHCYGPDPIKTFSNILTDADFVIDAIDLQADVSFSYEGMESLKDTYVSVNSVLAHIPKELQESYIDDYMEKSLKYTTYANGVYYHPVPTLTLLATKKP